MGVYTGRMRYTGTSGVDVESMVQSLMKAEGARADKLFRQKTRLEWQQNALRTMGTNIRGFRDSYLSFSSTSTVNNMRSTSSFLSKSISGSFSGGSGSLSTGATSNILKLSSGSTMTIGADAEAGDYNVAISSVASKQVNGGNVMSSAAVGDVELDPTQISGGDYLNIKVNGSSQRLVFTDEEMATVGADKEQFRALLQDKIDTAFGKLGAESKVNVTLTADNKLSLAANANVGSTFEVNMGSGIVNPTKASTQGGVMTGVSTDSSNFAAEGTDTFTIGGEVININFGATKLEGEDKVTNKAEYLEALNKKLEDQGVKASASFGTDGNIVFQTTDADAPVVVSDVQRSVTTPATNAAKDENGDIIVDGSGNPLDADGNLAYNLTNDKGELLDKDGNITFTDDSGDNITGFGMADEVKGTSLEGGASIADKIGLTSTNLSSTFDTGQLLGVDGTETITVNGVEKTIDYTADMTYKDFMTKVSEATDGDLSLTFSTTSNTFKLQSTTVGSAGNFSIQAGGLLNSETGFNLNTTPQIEASDAKVTITAPDGIETTIVRETNNFSYGGITLNLDSSLEAHIAASTDVDGEGNKVLNTEISVTADTTTAFDNIKGFIESYNKLVDELSSATRTTRAKSGDYGYFEPLTEEEKQGLSDNQLKSLEDKAKQGLLYRNPELERLQTKLREITTTEITMEDGSKMSLASIGITTGDYSQGGKLFITDEAKLRDALDKNPEGVAAVFTDGDKGVSEIMYDAIDDAVGSKGYITTNAGFTDSVYVNDNYYSKLIESKSNQLSRLNEYLIGKENHYYKMFSYMETAINNANSQLAAFGY